MRISVDSGGTFTDLVLEDGARVELYKRPTVPEDPVAGILDVVAAAAEARATSTRALLAATTTFTHATTHALNALLTGDTARTALLVTAGHADVLVLREGGREHFNVREPYPPPYVPRSLTFEISERVDADGTVSCTLEEGAAAAVIDELVRQRVKAVAVCLLWSIVNPVHELLLGELLARRLPDIPFTLSHQLAPAVREFRRASATAIDASLKPRMSRYLATLERRLREAGLAGRLFIVSSTGGLLDAETVAAAPIHSIKSGPAMAPVAAQQELARELDSDVAIVTDTGGTSYDVSVVRAGIIPATRETWLGKPYLSHMTGFPSIDVRSYGAGGGSIASVDAAGLLHVGPQSAGADPGPVAYGRGGTRPTVTDAALVLGLLDPDDFLGGRIVLDRPAAAACLERGVGRPLGLDDVSAAAAVLELMTEHMVGAIEETAIRQGIDPTRAVLVAGGGAAGLNCVRIASRLGCPRVLVPAASPALSAVGALRSHIVHDAVGTLPMRTDRFDYARLAPLLARLEAEARAFLEGAAGAGGPADNVEISYFAEGHYAREVWDIEVAFAPPLCDAETLAVFRRAFDAHHEDLYAVSDPDAVIEIVSWRLRAVHRLQWHEPRRAVTEVRGAGPATRRVFGTGGWSDVPVYRVDELAPGIAFRGPAIAASPLTTTVIDAGAEAQVSDTGALLIRPPLRTGTLASLGIGA